MDIIFHSVISGLIMIRIHFALSITSKALQNIFRAIHPVQQISNLTVHDPFSSQSVQSPWA